MRHLLSVNQKVCAIQIGAVIAAPIAYIKEHRFQWEYELREWWRTYVLKEKDCDNCKYFGGCCCDHLDEYGNCLGWERANLSFIHKWIYQYKIKRLAKKLKVDPLIMELLKK